MSDTRPRLIELDALRGVAVLLVMAFHYSTRFHDLYAAAAQQFDFSLGRYGVHVFFVISGFVITMTLAHSARPLDFVVARFSRLFPTYWTAILITSATLWLFRAPIEPPGGWQILVNFTMLPDFFHVASVDGVYWTLEVELLFYCIALTLMSLRLLERIYLPLLGWLALASLHALVFRWGMETGARHYLGFAGRLLILEYAPFFVIGIMFHRLYCRQGNPLWNCALIALAYALVALFQPLTVTLLIAATCFVFWQVSHGGWRLLRFRPLVFFGSISYPLYLLHQKIGYAIMLALLEHHWTMEACIMVATTLSIALATLVTYTVEQPALRAIRRKYKQLSARQATALQNPLPERTPVGIPVRRSSGNP